MTRLRGVVCLGLILALCALGPATPGASGQTAELANSWTTGLTHAAGAGSDRLLVLVAGMENGKDTTLAPPPDRSILSATYGGQALTRAEEVSMCTKNTSGPDHTYFCGRTELWYLLENDLQAASGSDFIVNWTGEPPFELEEHYAAVTLRNVSQVTPIGDTQTDTTSTMDPLPLSTPLNVVAGDLVIVSAFSGNDSTYATPATYTEGTDQNALSSTMATSYKSIAVAGTEQPSADFEDAINRQLILGVVIQSTQSDLSLTKTVDDPTPDEGQNVIFTIAVTNGGDPATGVQVTDLLPDSLSFVSYVASDVTDTYSEITGVWDLGSLGIGQSDTLYITATNDGWTDPIANIAEISAADQYDPDSTPGNSIPSEDDYGEVTLTPTGVSGGGGGGIESDGTMAEKLASVLFRRRRLAQETSSLITQPPPFESGYAGKVAGASQIGEFIPREGPRGSAAFETSPRDLLPVTNAVDIVAVDYLREDSRRVAAVFAAATEGEVYEHTKAICDRLRGAVLDDVRLVEVHGLPFILTKIVHPSKHVDYAISFIVYQVPEGFVLDSRFRLEEYGLQGLAGTVFNYQVWAASEEYATEMAGRIIDALSQKAAIRYASEANAPVLPKLYVRTGRYHEGQIEIDLFNAVSERVLRLGAGVLTRAEGGDPEFFEMTVDVPAPDEHHVSRVVVPVGPVFDIAFFVESEEHDTRDQLYLADGTWGFAADEEDNSGAVDFRALPEPTNKRYEAGKRALERGIRISGDVRTWAAAFRYLQPGGIPTDLTEYQYLEFTASGSGQFRVLVEKASITSSDQYGTVVSLSAKPKTYRVWFEDLRRDEGAGGFVANDVVLVSFYLIGEQGRPRSYDATITDITLGGGIGDQLAEVPEALELKPNYPNPFNPATRIRFGLPDPGHVTVIVYDAIGRQVARLVSREFAAGRHEVTFDASGLPSGLYLYRLATRGGALTGTMILMK